MQNKHQVTYYIYYTKIRPLLGQKFLKIKEQGVRLLGSEKLRTGVYRDYIDGIYRQ